MKPYNGDFVEAVLKPYEPVPSNLKIPHDNIGRRFSVYRNNVVASLIESLEVAFPVIKKLVGDEFFQAMAALYVRQYPPSSPLMMFYGNKLPEFLKSFQPVQHLPYLHDTAQLEFLLRESYHAGDPEQVDPEVLVKLTPEEQVQTCLEFNPAVKLLFSQYPVASIWEANVNNGPKPKPVEEYVIIVRPEFDPYPINMSQGGFYFIQALMKGNTIGQACEMTLFHSNDYKFDLTELFRLLLTTNSIGKVVR